MRAESVVPVAEMPDDDRKLFSLLTASARLRERGLRPTSQTSLIGAIARGDLVAKRIAPRTWVIRKAALEAYGSKLEARAARESPPSTSTDREVGNG